MAIHEIQFLDCPFCESHDFDLLGLKIHLLNGWCDRFNGIGREIPTSRDVTRGKDKEEKDE